MQAQPFTDHRLDLGNLVLGQVGGETLGQVVFGEGVSQQVLVEEDPTLAFFTERLIEQGHKQLADRGRPRPGFMSEGDEGTRIDRATDLPRRLGNFQTRFQDRQPLFKVGMLGHETPPICVLA